MRARIPMSITIKQLNEFLDAGTFHLKGNGDGTVSVVGQEPSREILKEVRWL